MSFLNLLLAAILVYLPYQNHYKIVFDLKGLNLVNLMFFGALLLILLRASRTASPTPLKGRFLLFFFALGISFLIGQLYDGTHWDADITQLKNVIFQMLFYFLFFHAARSVKDVRFLLGAILFVTFLVSLQTFRQAVDYGLGVYNESRRAAGPFAANSSGANLAAAFFVIFIPLFIGLALHKKSATKVRLGAAFCAGFGIFAAFFTYSRQAYFILALLMLIQLLRRNLLLGILIAVALFNYEAWAPEGVIERIQMTETTNQEGDGKKLDESTESRFILWEGAKKMISERPWGIGLNHFQTEMGKYVPGYSNFDVHNGYLLVTSEVGVQGLLALLWLMAGVFGLARRVEKLDMPEESRALGSTFQISIMAMMLANLFGSRFFNGEVLGDFWALTGLIARYYTLELERRASESCLACRS